VGHVYAGTISEKTASYMRMPNPLEGNTALQALTISAWVKRANAKDLIGTAWGFCESSPTSTTAQNRLFYTPNNYLGFTNQVDTFAVNYPKTSNTLIPAGEWKHVSVVIDKTTGITIYINGIKRTSSFASTAGSTMANFDMQKVMDVIAGAKYFCLGMGNGASSAEADYDDLLIYDRALTSEDAKLLYSMEKRVTDYTARQETNIQNIFSEDKVGQITYNHYYDLSGRRISTPLKSGIYLHNGKKIHVK